MVKNSIGACTTALVSRLGTGLPVAMQNQTTVLMYTYGLEECTMNPLLCLPIVS